MKKPKKNKRRLAPTVNTRAKTVARDAESHQALLDHAARADVYEAIKQAVDDIEHGRTRPAREVLSEFRRRHGIPR